MERTEVNPWTWSVAFGFNQAELVEGAGKVLFCAGQTSVDADGSPQHAGDMAGADRAGRRQPRGGPGARRA